MATRLIRSLLNLTPGQNGVVMTIGNFDGIHLGHQKLVQKVIDKARELGTESLVMTFEPHPFEFFSPDNLTIPRLTRLREKFRALAACGVDNVLIMPFNQEIASLSSMDFVTKILYDKLHPAHIVVGDDFRFGHKRSGDVETLRSMGHTLGFTVESMDSLDIAGERVSSTRVRKALEQGDHQLAEVLLGHPYTMLGRVRGGDQLGRQLGFPTANIFLHRQLTPVKGVYAVLVEGLSEKPLPGAANVGTRPTINGRTTLLEVHLLDFNQDIYGRYVQVTFCKKLRDEERYESLDILREQIAKDVEVTRQYFKKHGVL